MAAEVVICQSQELVAILARQVEAEVRAALAARNACSVALTGGSLAQAAYPVLVRVPLDWSRVDFFQGDERAVPPAHADSNYRAARELWFEPAGVPEPRVHRMRGEAADLEAAARDYSAELVRVLGTPPRLDLALLGVGPDGHVCSLFPGHPLLAEEGRWVAAIEDSPKPPPHRLTLTLPALAACRLVVVAALGKEKTPVMREALERPGSALPVAQVLRRAPRALVLVEKG